MFLIVKNNILFEICGVVYLRYLGLCVLKKFVKRLSKEKIVCLMFR